MSFYVRQVPFTAGTTEVRDLNSLPARSPRGLPYEIRSILLQMRLVLVSASTSDAIAAASFSRILSALEFRDNTGKRMFTDNPISGRCLRAIQPYLRKIGYVDTAAAIAANSNTTNTSEINLVIPLRLETLHDPDLHQQLAARLKGGEISVTWCASTEFGTGQVITAASSYMNIYVDIVEVRKLRACPNLVIGSKAPTQFDRDVLQLLGKPLVVGYFRPEAAGVIAANDYTHLEVRGDNLDINRQAFDAPTMEYNANQAMTGIGGDADRLLPSGGSAPDAIFYAFPNGAKISELPTENSLTITVTTGAGAPTTTEQLYMYVVSRPVDLVTFADSVSASPDIALDRQQVLQAFAADQKAEGNSGTVDPGEAKHVYPWLPKPVNLAQARYVG